MGELLRKHTIEAIIAVGERLTDSKSRLKHGEWAPWLKKNFGWSDSTALNLMNVHKLAISEEFKSVNFKELRIAVSALYALARPSTPKEVQAKVIEDAKTGKYITIEDVKPEPRPTTTETSEADGQEASVAAEESAFQPTTTPTETSEGDGQEAPSAAADVSEREKPKDWRVRDIRGTFVDLVKIALDIKKKYDGLAQEHLDPDALYQALHAVDDLEKSTATGRKAIGILNTFFGAVESTFGFLPAPPPPMFDDKADDGGASSDTASSDATPEEVS